MFPVFVLLGTGSVVYVFDFHRNMRTDKCFSLRMVNNKDFLNDVFSVFYFLFLHNRLI